MDEKRLQEIERKLAHNDEQRYEEMEKDLDADCRDLIAEVRRLNTEVERVKGLAREALDTAKRGFVRERHLIAMMRG